MHHFAAVILSISLCFAEFPAHSQSAARDKAGYRDFVLDGKKIWLLTNSGKLKVVDWASVKIIESEIRTDTSVVAVAKDRAGSIIISDASNKIRQFDKINRRWLPLSQYDGKLTGIVFDAKNQCYAITDSGIVNTNKHERFFPDSTFRLNKQIKNTGRWFDIPAYYMDKDNRIWVGFDYGEWGGNVFCFDSRNTSFVKLTIDSVQMNTNPVSSFCEDANSVYMSGGVTHIFLTHSSILKFKNETASPIFLSKDREMAEKGTFKGPDGKKKTETWTTMKGGHRIGPAAYNPRNKALYFYSQYGIFKGNLTNNLATIENWSIVLKPKLEWTGGRSNAVGPTMNVSKMQFSPNGTLFFLSEHNGLGIYDGKALRFIR